MLNLTPVLESQSFQYCSFHYCRLRILCAVLRCAVNTKKKHICSRASDGARQNVLDCCFLTRRLPACVQGNTGQVSVKDVQVSESQQRRCFVTRLCFMNAEAENVWLLWFPMWQSFLTGTIVAKRLKLTQHKSPLKHTHTLMNKHRFFLLILVLTICCSGDAKLTACGPKSGPAVWCQMAHKWFSSQQ